MVVEAAPAAVFEQIVGPAASAGRIAVVSSAGALLPRMHLVEQAKASGGRIIVPTGALLGLDAVRAAAEGAVESVTLVTRKPPRGLAGVGPDSTTLEIWADPTVTRNTHTVKVEADTVRLTMTIENVPSEENPRTGRITPLSLLACLRGLVSTLKVGS